MKKEAKKISGDNSCGITGVNLGILSIVFASVVGLVIGIIALVFSIKQQKKSPNKWGRSGKILAIIGIVLSLLTFAFNFWLLQNPDFMLRLAGQG